MTGVFADTFYYLALLNPRDSAHEDAVAIGEGLAGRLVTTQYVLAEVADALPPPVSGTSSWRYWTSWKPTRT